MLSQSARTNLQVKLISDARKLLEKVQSQDANASIDSSFDSFHSAPVFQKPEPPEPPSPSKFNEILFVQKSRSEQEKDDDESISIGNLSYSRSERGDEFSPEHLDTSAMDINSPYRVSHMHKSISMRASHSRMPTLAAVSSEGWCKSDEDASFGDSSDEVQDLVNTRLKKLNSSSVCSANSADGRDDDDDDDSASFGSYRILSKDESFKVSSAQRTCRHLSSQGSNSILQEGESVLSGHNDPFEADNASICSLKSLKAESMLSSAKNLIASYSARSLKSSESASSKSSAESHYLNLVRTEPSEDDCKKEVTNFSTQTTLGTKMRISHTINSDVQNEVEIKVSDSLLSGKSVETESVSSDNIAELAIPENKQNMGLCEGGNSNGEESIKSAERSSVSSSSQKSSSSDSNKNVESIRGQTSLSADACSILKNSKKLSPTKSLESANSSSISEKSQKSSSVQSVQSIDANSMLLSLQKGSSAEIVESADAKSVLSSVGDDANSVSSKLHTSSTSTKKVVDNLESVESAQSAEEEVPNDQDNVQEESAAEESVANEAQVEKKSGDSDDELVRDKDDGPDALYEEPVQDKDENSAERDGYNAKSISSQSEKSASAVIVEPTDAKSVSSQSEKSVSVDIIEESDAKSVSSQSEKSASAVIVETTDAKSVSSHSEKLSSAVVVEPTGAKSVSSHAEKSVSADIVEETDAKSIFSHAEKSVSVDIIEESDAKSVSSHSEKSASAVIVEPTDVMSVSSHAEKSASAVVVEPTGAKSVSSHLEELDAGAKKISMKSQKSSSSTNALVVNIESGKCAESADKNNASLKSSSSKVSMSAEKDEANSASLRLQKAISPDDKGEEVVDANSGSSRSQKSSSLESGNVSTAISAATNDICNGKLKTSDESAARSIEGIEVRSKSSSKQRYVRSKVSKSSGSSKIKMAPQTITDPLQSAASESTKISSNSIKITRKSKTSVIVVRNKDDENTSQIIELKDLNKKLQEENLTLLEDMNSFDEKLACLEITLGIIDSVEKRTAEFDNEEAELERLEQDEKVHNHDDYSTLSGDTRLSQNSRRSFFSRSSKIKGIDGKSALSWTLRSTGSRRSVTSKFSRRSKALKGADDEAGDKSFSSATSQQSRSSIQSERSNKSNKSFHSAISRQSSLTSIGEEKPTLDAVESRDELLEGTRVRTASASSKMTTFSATSMSRREHNELKMLRENNENMLYAIKALSKATTIQTRKHYHYKKKFGHTRKNLVEGNIKLSQLELEKEEVTSDYYNTRAQFLQEQDKREELSDSVQVLAKKMNGLRKKLKAEEETKMSLLDRIDENSVISVTSISNSISASVSSRLSAIDEHSHEHDDDASASVDSLDEILSPKSRNAYSKEQDENDKYQVKLVLELEVKKLKAKLDRRESKIDRLQKKFSVVKGYLKGIEEGAEESADVGKAALVSPVKCKIVKKDDKVAKRPLAVRNE